MVPVTKEEPVSPSKVTFLAFKALLTTAEPTLTLPVTVTSLLTVRVPMFLILPSTVAAPGVNSPSAKTTSESVLVSVLCKVPTVPSPANCRYEY